MLKLDSIHLGGAYRARNYFANKHKKTSYKQKTKGQHFTEKRDKKCEGAEACC